MAAPLTAPVEALDLFAGLLTEAEAGTGEAFHSRLAEATCRLAAMRRAVLFVYDEERRAVRAAGAHGMDLALFGGASPTASQVELARRALVEDRVIEVPEHAERELPEEFHPLLLGGLLTCTPMSAGGHWLGVIIADRPREAGPLTDAQRHTLWTLGKVAALAATARRATRQHMRARQIDERMRIARDVHDAVVQRLFGVSLALSGDGPITPETRARCREEIGAALGELRVAIQRPGSLRPQTDTKLRAEIERLTRAHRDIRVELVDGADVEVPPELESVTQSVLREAVRNAGKHSDATWIEIRLNASDEAFMLEVINDGVEPSPRKAAARGVGLRLAAFEALEHGGVVEFGHAGPGRWRVKLTVPLEDEG
jgi:signal transduction histidine kinase